MERERKKKIKERKRESVCESVRVWEKRVRVRLEDAEKKEVKKKLKKNAKKSNEKEKEKKKKKKRKKKVL